MVLRVLTQVIGQASLNVFRAFPRYLGMNENKVAKLILHNSEMAE